MAFLLLFCGKYFYFFIFAHCVFALFTQYLDASRPVPLPASSIHRAECLTPWRGKLRLAVKLLSGFAMYGTFSERLHGGAMETPPKQRNLGKHGPPRRNLYRTRSRAKAAELQRGGEGLYARRLRPQNATGPTPAAVASPSFQKPCPVRAESIKMLTFFCSARAARIEG